MNFPIPYLPGEVSMTLIECAVHAGFPSPAADYAQSRIDLNRHLLINENASFLFRVLGESMTGIGIYDGDTLIVDRSITPAHNQIVLAVIDDEFTVKRLYRRGQDVRLIAENPAFPPIILKEGQELRIWGVVTFNLHRLLNV
ncbi:translesion error-prone DNA polymerase V autoproteolytic subunit [Undibacterium oligocarboniphilum]|uniref:Translesion error-prone DNA polymerase V autoproteolytic subunit n=2 Tax=Undibacterium oligocarboniphilum TaxID=666702 RepID=A0A850QP67_9BURK|nr:translesion error-prone DNA polymerase V autoproteolytic subunit [Undibacterium oligocarboniphilum]NVO79475.1 translesion error-prone DNA polymerase V autoproteolytic subunit [Undibacterium oligocarboniphilum]